MCREHAHGTINFTWVPSVERMVRKLRGPVKKESKEERRQRRRDNVEGKQKILTVAVPVVLGVIGLVVFLVWMKSWSVGSATPS